MEESDQPVNSNEADRTGSQEDLPDFSLLPDVVWVRILSCLPFTERSQVSRTCHLLHDVFTHPSLWDTCEIILSSRWESGQPSHYHFISPERHLKMINQFGSYIRNLTLVYIGYESKIPKDCAEVIEALMIKGCQVQNVILDIEKDHVSPYEMVVASQRKMKLEPIEKLVACLTHLRSITVRSWPNYVGLSGGDILSALEASANPNSLKKLAVYWEDAQNATWVTLNAIMPRPSQILQLVHKFENLTHLSLRSSMLSEEIIAALAKSHHSPMERLNILLTYSRLETAKHIPEIRAHVWQTLRDQNPNLLVEITVVTRIPYSDLSSFMKREIPVGGVGFMKYARVGEQDIQDIINKYSATLCKFICLADPEGLDDQILQMVEHSKALRYFIYHGFIFYETVQKLAAMHGENWYRFQVFEDHITTQRLVYPDADQVVERGPDGSCVLVQHQVQSHEHTMVERTQILAAMSEAVLKSLGHKWNAANTDSIEQVVHTGRYNAFSDDFDQLDVKSVPTKYAIANGWPWI